MGQVFARAGFFDRFESIGQLAEGLLGPTESAILVENRLVELTDRVLQERDQRLQFGQPALVIARFGRVLLVHGTLIRKGGILNGR